MSQKNEILVIALSFFTTVGLIAGGLWFFSRNADLSLNLILSSQLQNTTGKKDSAIAQDVPKELFNYGGSTSWVLIRPVLDVAIDGLGVAVNQKSNVSGLRVNQLRSIYTGKITKWRQVGGSNLPIKAYSQRISDGGTVKLFVQDILGGQLLGKQVELISTTTQALKKLAASPGGIYYASTPEVVPQCSIEPLPLGQTSGQYIAPYQEPFVLPNECSGKRNKLNIEAFQSGKYPITRNLFLVVKQNGQNEETAGRADADLLLTD